MKRLLAKTSGIILFSLLVIFSFSYGCVTTKWTIFFTLITIALIGLNFLQNILLFNIDIIRTAYAVLFLILFDFAEKVNFIYHFSISVELNWRIQLSTIFLAIGMLTFLMKVLVGQKAKFIEHPFMLHFFLACAFLIMMMVLFYPVLYSRYRIEPGPDIQLLNKVFKYLIISLLVGDYLSNEKRFKRISIGLIFSLSVTVVLSVVL